MDVMTELNKLTYAVQHNPNCPKPFLVRLVGPGGAIIDYQGEKTTKDICGYGMTLEEAARIALQKKEALRANPFRAFRQLERTLPGISNPAPFPRD